MFYAQQKLGWFFDPRRLIELARQEGEVELGSAFWYAGLKDPNDQRPFRDALTSLGYTVRTRPLRELAGEGESRQYTRANLDVEVAIDLDRLVEVLRAKGLTIIVFSTEGMVARELRNAADRFVDLASLVPQLAKVDLPSTGTVRRPSPSAA
jgi:uncharacterized LabA/DUF88 family protein